MLTTLLVLNNWAQEFTLENEQSDQDPHCLHRHFYHKPMTISVFRALDKREYLVIIRDDFCSLSIKTYVVTPHLNRLVGTVQMRGHIIWFR